MTGKRVVYALAIAVLTALPCAAQTAPDGWTAPHTTDGHPDLQGVWANNRATPLERPVQLADQATLTDEEQAALESIPDVDPLLREELGLAWTEGQPETIAERLLLPALNIRGITSGNTGALARNVIPNTAVAALGIRLVQGNDPDHLRQLVVNHIERQGFHVVSEDPDTETRLRYPRIARVTGGGGYPAARTRMADPFVQQAIGAASLAADRAFGPGSLVLAPGMGGTLPLYLFTDVAGKPAIVVPVANHDNNQHAPDENLRIANLWYAIDLYAALLSMPPGVS